MQIEQRPLASIRPYERNPRLNDHAVQAVADSIRKFGFRQPLLVDEESVIICGHTRWKAAQALAMETVPVHVATDMSPEDVRTYHSLQVWHSNDHLGRNGQVPQNPCRCEQALRSSGPFRSAHPCHSAPGGLSPMS